MLSAKKCFTVVSFSVLLAGSGLAKEHTVTTINFPGAIGSQANAINPEGDVVGVYVDATFLVHGFLLSKGAFTTIDIAAATLTDAFGINPRGDIVGGYK